VGLEVGGKSFEEAIQGADIITMVGDKSQSIIGEGRGKV